MSFTGPKYDKCYCREQITQATKPYDLIMDPIAFEHKNACRINLGFSDGNMVSTVGNTREAGNGELIDVDSILKGLDKFNSNCNPEQTRVQLNPGKTNDLQECTFVKKPYSASKKELSTRCV
jgi:hypothetical protein